MSVNKNIKIKPSLIPKVEVRVLSATFLEAVLRFYEEPENTAGFGRWLTEREGGIADEPKDCGCASGAVSDPCAATGGGAVAGHI